MLLNAALTRTTREPEPMHILNVNMSIDPVFGGGTATRTVKLSKFLNRSGEKITILTIGNFSRYDLTRFGFDINFLPCLNHRYHIPKANISALYRLIEKVDIIHLMNHWTPLNALVYLVARKTKTPYVFCPAGALTILGQSKILKRLYNMIIGYNIARQARACIAISPNEIKQFSDYKISGENIQIIPNGVDPEDFRFCNEKNYREKYGLGDSPFILFMGRLNHIKGPDLLIRAFSLIHPEFESWKLVLAGPDEGFQSSLMKIAQDLNVRRKVHFIGYVGCDDKSCSYHAADLLVIPSRQEAMSIVVLEAGICGTPVVLTDRCGFEEVEQVNGGEIVPATPEGLAHGIRKILSSQEYLYRCGHNLKRHVDKYFTWDVIAQKYLDLYQTILHGDAA